MTRAHKKTTPTLTRRSRYRSETLVLQPRRRRAFRERPNAVGELERQEAVVLTHRLQRTGSDIQAYLRRTPVRSTGNPAAGAQVIRPGASCRCACRVVV